jgi:hypothetical protein
MPELLEQDWKQGYLPSYDLHRDFGGESIGLLRMDNLTLDERGMLRLAKSSKVESIATFPQAIDSTFSALIGGKKYRYIYSNGTMKRNYGSGALQSTFDETIFSGGSVKRAAFANALGHVIAICDTKKYKDNTTVVQTMDIPIPVAPVVSTVNATGSIDCSNLDGSSKYTNWDDLSSNLVFDNTDVNIKIKANYGQQAFCFTDFSSPLDTTDFGGTGNETDADLFSFNIILENPNTFQWLQVVFSCDGSGGSNGTNYFASQLFKAELTINASGNTSIQIPRSTFTRGGTDSTKGWQSISSIIITLSHFPQDSDITHYSQFYGLQFVGGTTSQVTGTNIKYVAVEVNDTGDYLQFSVNSTPTTAITTLLNSVTLTRASAVDAQCNQFWLFRYDDETGIYQLVNIQTGALGFTPSTFTDTIPDLVITENAAINSLYILEVYRTALPNTIKGMLWFQNRLIYLTDDSFIPSFNLDPGSYDSRFVYQLTGSTSELVLFACKINVGMFVVATTKDFYQVTGTFSKIDLGNGVTTLDVTIKNLGVSNPAISRNFIEQEGSIIYLSATGLRTLINSSSDLINGPLDLLFRSESRYGMLAFALQPNDLTNFCCSTNGNRLYFSLPDTNGVNHTFVYTLIPAVTQITMAGSHWRVTTDAPTCMFREDDGTIIFGGAAGDYLRSIDMELQSVAINFKTQFNFGKNPEIRKQVQELVFFGNTGGNDLSLTILGYLEDASTVNHTFTINTSSEKVVRLDVNAYLESCLAYGFEIVGTTDEFSINYLLINYIEHAPIIIRAIQLPTNFGKPNKKKLATWPFRVDSRGNSIIVVVKGDGSTISGQLSDSSTTDVKTVFWRNIQDVAAVDWEILITCADGMEFYGLDKPEIVQLFPMGKLIDQLGPFDFKAQSMVFGMRLKVLNTGSILHYKLYDADTLVYENDITTLTGLDQSYLEKFPKGIDPAVLRVILSSTTVFHRFSLELKVRKLGKDTEESYVSVG